MIKYTFIAITLALTIFSCVKDKTIEPVDPIVPPGVCDETVFFQAEIMEGIMDVSCNTSGCHSAGDAAAGYTFVTYTQVKDNSTVIYEAITHDPARVAMPLYSDKLADSLIQNFDCWVQQGLLDN